MSNKSLLISIEIIMNETLKRISKLKGKDKISLQNEFREWINSIEYTNNAYDVLYINKINDL